MMKERMQDSFLIIIPTKTVKKISAGIIYQAENRSRESLAPRRSLKYGKLSFTKTTAKIRETKASINDSARNWVTSMPLVDPPTFLIPTSFDLLEAWAVARFMKLIAAITTIRIAMLAKMTRYLGSIGALNPP